MATEADLSSMPAADAPNVQLVPPTDNERINQWNITAVSWRGPQTIQAFVDRELGLATQLGIKDGGIKHWILVDENEKVAEGANRTILCSCETLRRKAIVSKVGTDGKRAVESTWCYGVAGVHTRKEFRGKGYGRRMISDIGKKMRGEQENYGMEKPLFSVLYSAVGVVSCVHVLLKSLTLSETVCLRRFCCCTIWSSFHLEQDL
jgi:GNAT superfamily N-acetyltransferase